MSFLYEQDPAEQTRLYDQALTGGAAKAPEPGFFSGAAEAPFTGVFSGLVAKPALILGDVVTPMLAGTARDAKMEGVAQWLEAEQQKNVDMLKTLKQRQQSYGTAANVLNGVADILPEAIAGVFAGGPVGGAGLPAVLQGYAEARMGVEEGLDIPTAIKKGAITGTAVGVGAGLPMSVGTKTLASALFGAGTNVGVGMAQRGATAELLESSGYPEQAAQYKWLDKEAIAVDAILGGAFGVMGAKMARRLPTETIDAALVANERLHVEIDSQPGIHATPESRDAGVQSFEKAVSDMLVRDTLPDVGETAARMDFVPNPEVVKFHSEVSKLVDAEMPKVEEPVSSRVLTAEEGRPLPPPPETPPKPHDGTPAGMARAADVNPVERDLARQILDTHPDLEVPVADGSRPFADMLAEADAEIATAQKDSLLHEVAVACFLRG